MNKNLQRLFNIASKEERLVVGLMSGTSLDGLDVALCSIEGSGLTTVLKLIHFKTVDYDDQFKEEIKSVFSKKTVDLEKLTLLHSWVAMRHAQIVLQCLQSWDVHKNDIDLIASHGQTIYHAPKKFHQNPHYGNATLQIGDGDHLAVATGIITISDFRQKHIACGGEGAPLAVYGDCILFSKKDCDRVLLNIGGIANFTFLPGSLKSEAIICTDIGPGNTMMDVYVQHKIPGKYYDENAVLALRGKINDELLNTLSDHSFFSEPFPKTTGPELFNLNYLQNAQRISDTQHLNAEDVLATLNKFSANAIVSALTNYFGSERKLSIYVSGGGVHNPLLIRQIKNECKNYEFFTTESLGVNPDAKEAMLFAILANECIAGGCSLFNNPINNIPVAGLGKISFPD